MASDKAQPRESGHRRWKPLRPDRAKAEARDLLRRFDGGGLEAWIAEQRWQAVPDGWTVTKDHEGWRWCLRASS